MRRFVSSLFAFAGVAVAGCTVGPDYVPPPPNVPDHFSEYRSASEATTRPATQPAPPTSQAVSGQLDRWWENFRDPQLNSLIERGVRSNLDLRAAEARIRQARAQYGVVIAGEYPALNLSGSASRSRGSTAVGSGSSLGNVNVSPRNLYQLGFDASWEIDVFGGVRRGIEAAEDDIQAAIEDRRNILLTLLSEVARDYIDYRGFARQIAIAQDNLKAQRETLNVTRRQFEAGLKNATELEVAQAQALVFSTESTIPTLETNLRQSAHAIGILLGKEPSAVVEELGAERPIPSAMIAVVPIGLPSDLLRRRPDIRRAERQLAASTARIGVATSDLFPKFSLTGSLGLESSKFKSIANYGSRFWSVGPSVSWPIFDFGQVRANIRVQNALQEQALVNYQTAVLISLQNVEDALVAYSNEQVRRRSLEQSVEASKRAVTIATERFQAGLTNFLNVLDAERSLFAAQDQLVQSDRQVSDNLVALFKALGGGWEQTEMMSGQPEKHPPAQ